MYTADSRSLRQITLLLKARSTRHDAVKHDGQKLVTRFYDVTSWPCDELTGSRYVGLHKPHTGRTGRCMNHAPAILAAPALIYSTHQLLVVWIIVVHFHLCSLLDRYTALEVWTVRRPMRVCCGSRRDGACFSLTFWTVWRFLAWSIIRPCIQYTAGAASMVGAWFIHWPVWPVRGLYGPCYVTCLKGQYLFLSGDGRVNPTF